MPERMRHNPNAQPPRQPTVRPGESAYVDEPDELDAEAPVSRVSVRAVYTGVLITAIVVLALTVAIIGLKKSGALDAPPESFADTENAKSLSSKTWSFSYPGNWELGNDIAGHDPDRYVLIKTPEGAHAKIELYSAEHGPGYTLTDKYQPYEKLATGKPEPAKPQTFREWGKLNGRGLRFYIPVEDTRHVVYLFVHQIRKDTHLVIHRMNRESIDANLDAGFELIAKTFALKPAEPQE